MRRRWPKLRPDAILKEIALHIGRVEDRDSRATRPEIGPNRPKRLWPRKVPDDGHYGVGLLYRPKRRVAILAGEVALLHPVSIIGDLQVLERRIAVARPAADETQIGPTRKEVRVDRLDAWRVARIELE